MEWSPIFNQHVEVEWINQVVASQEQKTVMIHKKTEAVKAIHDTKRQKDVGSINLTRVTDNTKIYFRRVRSSKSSVNPCSTTLKARLMIPLQSCCVICKFGCILY